MRLQFLGAAGTVTGSKYLLDSGRARVLVDCGLFQGLKALRLRNREPFPVDPAGIDAVVLTHAHIDHSGYLPLLVKQGFRGVVHCTPATHDLCKLLLPDSGRLQEEDAAYANRRGFSKHDPALPLYTEEDALKSLQLFRTVGYDTDIELGDGLRARFAPAGHILGSAIVTVTDGDGHRVLFSGDLGRPHDPVMKPPRQPPQTDWLLAESTYGDRLHERVAAWDELQPILSRTVARGGVVVIPAFAVGRAQVLLHGIARLKRAGRLPRSVPVFLDSPMAIDVTDLYLRHREDHRLDDAECEALRDVATFINTVEQSKRLGGMHGPMIIIAASGMATGGRVVHHLKTFAPDPRNTVLFSGHQAAGTRGAAMLDGARTIRIHGQDVPVRAEVAVLSSLSAHADHEEMLDWMHQLPKPPRMTWLVHGDPDAAAAMRGHVERELHWPVEVPQHLQIVGLDASR